MQIEDQGMQIEDPGMQIEDRGWKIRGKDRVFVHKNRCMHLVVPFLFHDLISLATPLVS